MPRTSLPGERLFEEVIPTRFERVTHSLEEGFSFLRLIEYECVTICCIFCSLIAHAVSLFHPQSMSGGIEATSYLFLDTQGGWL